MILYFTTTICACPLFFQRIGYENSFFAILIMEGKMAKTEYMYVDKDTRALLNGIKKTLAEIKKQDTETRQQEAKKRLITAGVISQDGKTKKKLKF